MRIDIVSRHVHEEQATSLQIENSSKVFFGDKILTLIYMWRPTGKRFSQNAWRQIPGIYILYLEFDINVVINTFGLTPTKVIL